MINSNASHCAPFWVVWWILTLCCSLSPGMSIILSVYCIHYVYVTYLLAAYLLSRFPKRKPGLSITHDFSNPLVVLECLSHGLEGRWQEISFFLLFLIILTECVIDSLYISPSYLVIEVMLLGFRWLFSCYLNYPLHEQNFLTYLLIYFSPPVVKHQEKPQPGNRNAQMARGKNYPGLKE